MIRQSEKEIEAHKMRLRTLLLLAALAVGIARSASDSSNSTGWCSLGCTKRLVRASNWRSNDVFPPSPPPPPPPPPPADLCPMIAFSNMTGVPEPLNVTEGEPLVVECMCMTEMANLTTLSWDGESGALGQSAVLNFTAVRAEDDGVYNCSGMANGSDAGSASFTLRVLGELGPVYVRTYVLVHASVPVCVAAVLVVSHCRVHSLFADARLTVSVSPPSVEVPVNSSVSLLCNASGGTPRAYSWQRDGNNVPGENASTYNFTAGMDGNYSCSAENGAGTFPSPHVQLAVFGVCTHTLCHCLASPLYVLCPCLPCRDS